MEKIKRIAAREILDSRGNPTLETTLFLENGGRVAASVPSGASTGSYEAHELRDGGKRYGGKGVQKAVDHVNRVIGPKIIGFSVTDQAGIDQELLHLDGTKEKKRLGANALLSVSLAAARGGALAEGLPLYRYLRDKSGLRERGWRMPQPMMNVINGGRHATNGLSVQEFMILPKHRNVVEQVRIGSEVFHALSRLLEKKRYATGVGDEGGFAPAFPENESALKFLMTAVKEAGYTPGVHVVFALDVAASEFHSRRGYLFEGKRPISSEKMLQAFSVWMKKYPLVSIEDPFAEDDWSPWVEMTKKYGSRLAIVGDDLFVTNIDRLGEGIKQGAANTILIKPNQIGTLSETFATIRQAKSAGYRVIVSHRSGETADTFIADLAVAVHADGLKAGSLSRSERVEKYNRLMQISLEVG